ncbi:recombinase family protein [Paenibacillus sp. P96]|uniref:Recombinase family protein n=1 Tax=Paenibacillus zeirhizosphaerae TaxID=2987519 RepID=A0ABT9FNC1_9BACL|nr:recombinase family protein [Paenibacillus sp. P96]MDP4096232.1 recombinase family protein [Paenibacillus sp. P96]
MNGNTGISGALYLRISRDKGENEDTLQNHRELMEEFCREHGYTFEVYEEIVSGGKYNLDARPQLQRLLDNIERYKIIFAVSLDRLSRNGLVSQQIKQLCIDHDVKIMTPAQTFNLSGSQEDRLLYDVSSLFATLEYEMIGRRAKANKIQRARRGEHVSGKAAYGYRRNPDTKQLEIYEPEAGVVRYIFKLYIEGFSCRKIANLLNREGFTTQQLNDFLPINILLILRNPVYKGTLVFQNRKRIKKGQVHSYKVLETIITDHAHPAIISPDDWEQANRKRMEGKGQTPLTREKLAGQTGATMLKDLLFCGVCGNKLEIQKKRHGVLFIRACRNVLPDSRMKCNNQGMKLQFLEEEVVLQIQSHKQRLAAHLLQQQEGDVNLMDLQERLAMIETRLLENKRLQGNLIELALEDVLSHEELKAKKQTLLEQGHMLQETKEKIVQQIRNIEAVPLVDLTIRMIRLLEEFQSLTVEEQNETLKQFVKQIHYERVMPEGIRKQSTRSQERQTYPFRYTIEYYS